MHYTFVIKMETFDQDMRELCHQLNVENKECLHNAYNLYFQAFAS